MKISNLVKLTVTTEAIIEYLCAKRIKMQTVDHIRNDLIDRIMTITNKDFLIALNNLLSVSETETQVIALTKEQELMLKMSDVDIKEGRTISHEDFKDKTNQWLETRIG